MFYPKNFKQTLLKNIFYAKKRIFILTLYFENDESGKCIMSALYQAKKNRPDLDICILVDWHRAKRGKYGSSIKFTNSDWYKLIAHQNPQVSIPIYGVPINNIEILGVFHMKGIIIDNILIYTGASINNDYLHEKNKYRFDRYQVIKNKVLTDIMISWIKKNLKSSKFTYIINNYKKKVKIKNSIKKFRQILRSSEYELFENSNNLNLSLTPLLGLGKKSLLNKTINNLILSTEKKIIFCTPYFNFPNIIKKNIIHLLKNNIKVEIIVGDKTANDFFIPIEQPFKIIGTLPYLYENNLRFFINKFKNAINLKLLTIRLWKDGLNTFHSKGIWVDDKWILITGNNLNLRGWKLDLENAILIHDPLKNLLYKFKKELQIIKNNTIIIQGYKDIENINEYPKKIKKIVKILKRTKLDKIINLII